MDRVLIGRYFGRGAPRLYLGLLFFLVYTRINDVAVGLKCNVKPFADDASLFTVVEESMQLPVI